MTPPLFPHQQLFAHADQWFNRARAALLGALPCQRGCCRCCVGSFAITLLDVDTLQEGLATLPPETRLCIEQRAREQAEAMEAVYPRLKKSRDVSEWEDDQLDHLAEHFADLPCPALAADGSCHIYDFRPFTCRTTGIPVEHDGVVHGACEVQTAVPLIKLSHIVRTQEDDLAAREAHALHTRRISTDRLAESEEVFLPYGFLNNER